MISAPERPPIWAYKLQRHYSQNRSDDYYLGAFVSGLILASIMRVNVFNTAYYFGGMSLLYSGYEFHGDTIEYKFRKEVLGQDVLSAAEQMEKEMGEEGGEVSSPEDVSVGQDSE